MKNYYTLNSCKIVYVRSNGSLIYILKIPSVNVQKKIELKVTGYNYIPCMYYKVCNANMIAKSC